jgi:hypothetical protein
LVTDVLRRGTANGKHMGPNLGAPTSIHEIVEAHYQVKIKVAGLGGLGHHTSAGAPLYHSMVAEHKLVAVCGGLSIATAF